jgi:hypothetical protein
VTLDLLDLMIALALASSVLVAVAIARTPLGAPAREPDARDGARPPL